MRGKSAFGLLVVAAGLSFAGCAADASQIIVIVDAEPGVQSATQSVRVQVFGASRDESLATTSLGSRASQLDTTLETSGLGDPFWGRTRIALAPEGDDPSRLYRVEVYAHPGPNQTGEVVASTYAISGYVEGQTRVLRLLLRDACIGVVCDPDDVCFGAGECGSPFVPPDDLPPETDAGDTGVDAGSDSDSDADAASDGGDCVPGAVCDTGNLCELGAVRCEGDIAVCEGVGFRPASETCRAAAGECDVAEMCDGRSPTCPADENAPTGTVCAGGYCVDGTCGACEPGARCDPGECEVGRIECARGVPTCLPTGLKPAGAVCRDASGLCDASDVCDGMSAECVDTFRTGTCRPAAGPCDTEEVCDGASADCPADSFARGSLCRPAAGGCDVAEACDGSGRSCPEDARVPSGRTCRDAVDACDVAESCDGVSAVCPSDRYAPAGTTCPSGACDGAGGCGRFMCGNACSTGNECELGRVDCTSGSPVCMPDGLRSSSHVCRPSAGVCDRAETCTGGSPTCPTDTFSAGMVCRAAAGPCDVAESCSGSSATCPGDAFQIGSTCRAATGECDRAETCTGASPACPVDVFEPDGTPCMEPSGRTCMSGSCDLSTGTCLDCSMCANGAPCGPIGEDCECMGDSCNLPGSPTSCPMM